MTWYQICSTYQQNGQSLHFALIPVESPKSKNNSISNWWMGKTRQYSVEKQRSSLNEEGFMLLQLTRLRKT